MSKVFIDAGHGGHDSGASGEQSKEKDNSLNIALALGKLLKSKNYTVKYSRKNDKYLSLTERTNLANDWKADIFISVHNNSSESSISGFESYIYITGKWMHKRKDYNRKYMMLLLKISILLIVVKNVIT